MKAGSAEAETMLKDPANLNTEGSADFFWPAF